MQLYRLSKGFLLAISVFSLHGTVIRDNLPPLSVPKEDLRRTIQLNVKEINAIITHKNFEQDRLKIFDQYESKTLKGIRISKRPLSVITEKLISAFGLKKDDILIGLNDGPLPSLEPLFDVWRDLRGRRPIVLFLIRKKILVIHTYEIIETK